MYINDVVDNISSSCFLFADDALLMDEVDSLIDSAIKLNNNLNFIQWLVTMNPQKTKSMTFSSKLIKPLHPSLYLGNEVIEDVSQHDHLGVTFTSNLS